MRKNDFFFSKKEIIFFMFENAFSVGEKYSYWLVIFFFERNDKKIQNLFPEIFFRKTNRTWRSFTFPLSLSQKAKPNSTDER